MKVIVNITTLFTFPIHNSNSCLPSVWIIRNLGMSCNYYLSDLKTKYSFFLQYVKKKRFLSNMEADQGVLKSIQMIRPPFFFNFLPPSDINYSIITVVRYTVYRYVKQRHQYPHVNMVSLILCKRPHAIKCRGKG